MAAAVACETGQQEQAHQGARTLSRSTSAGSSATRSDEASTSKAAASPSAASPTIPSLVYPVPVAVRNTFFDVDVGRDPSLDGFFLERQVRSCPGSEVLPMTEIPELVTETPPPEEQPATSPKSWMPHWMTSEPEQSLWFQTAKHSSPWQSETDHSWQQYGLVPDHGASHQIEEIWQVPSWPPPVPAQAPMPMPPAPAPVRQEPQLGSAELPTRGSAGHRMGVCKPCAFAHTKGCGSGVDCTFCHLCQPGEKLRRRKERLHQRHQADKVGSRIQASPEWTVPASAWRAGFTSVMSTIATSGGCPPPTSGQTLQPR